MKTIFQRKHYGIWITDPMHGTHNKQIFKRKFKKKKKAKKFYKTSKWIALRYRAIKKYGNKCMACGRSPKDGIIIHVDHIKPRSTHPELEYDINNLQILCEDCNIGKSNIDATDWRKNS